MALETVVYSQADPFGYGYIKDFCSLLGGAPGGANWSYDFCHHHQQQEDYQELEEEDKSLVGIFDNHIMQDQTTVHANWDNYSSSPPNSVPHNTNNELGLISDPNSSPEACTVDQSLYSPPDHHHHHQSADPPVIEPPSTAATVGRRKRRRTRSSKNKEELENQRMTHIAVERNRRKQMNEYLAVLRSLMPPSYVQRGDQASIIGGAINFVKELEQFLQTMESHQHKRTKKQDRDDNGFSSSSPSSPSSSSPLAEFFTFPQYSTRGTAGHCNPSENSDSTNNNQWAAGDIEVTMVDSHANLKILCKKLPRLLLKIVASLQALRFTVLHLNVTTVDQKVLYSVSVKIEEGCQLNTVDEIAGAVNQMLRRIQEEPAFT